MKKIIIAIALTAALSHGYMRLLSCRWQGQVNNYRGGYVGTYESNSGNIYQFVFSTWCPYSMD
jgi:hypothetical protein